MEETVVTDASFLEVLLTSPATYIIALIIGMTIHKLKNEKSSSKCGGSNKTSMTKKPVAKKTAPKKVAKKAPAKKTPTKKAIYKKTVVKRTPKKGGK